MHPLLFCTILIIPFTLGAVKFRIDAEYDKDTQFTEMTGTWIQPFVYLKPSKMPTFNDYIKPTIAGIESAEEKAQVQHVVDELGEFITKLRDQNLENIFEAAEEPEQVTLHIIGDTYHQLNSALACSVPETFAKECAGKVFDFVYPICKTWRPDTEIADRFAMAKFRVPPKIIHLMSALHTIRLQVQ